MEAAPGKDLKAASAQELERVQREGPRPSTSLFLVLQALPGVKAEG
jgi:hypothetical protein